MSETATDPFAPPQASVEIEDTGIALAGRGQRLLAAILDVTTIGIVVVIAGFIAAWSASSSDGDVALTVEQVVRHMGPFTLMLVLAVVGANVFTLATRSASLGKVMIGIHIARPNGERAGFWRIVILRSWVWGLAIHLADKVGAAVGLDAGEEYELTLGTGLWLVGVLFIFGSARRCLHDYLADTIVVRTKGKLVLGPNRAMRAIRLPKDAPTA